MNPTVLANRPFLNTGLWQTTSLAAQFDSAGFAPPALSYSCYAGTGAHRAAGGRRSGAPPPFVPNHWQARLLGHLSAWPTVKRRSFARLLAASAPLIRQGKAPNAPFDSTPILNSDSIQKFEPHERRHVAMLAYYCGRHGINGNMAMSPGTHYETYSSLTRRVADAELRPLTKRHEADAQYLRMLEISRNVRAADLAKKFSSSHYHMIRAGTYTLGRIVARQLAGALQVAPEQLTGPVGHRRKKSRVLRVRLTPPVQQLSQMLIGVAKEWHRGSLSELDALLGCGTGPLNRLVFSGDVLFKQSGSPYGPEYMFRAYENMLTGLEIFYPHMRTTAEDLIRNAVLEANGWLDRAGHFKNCKTIREFLTECRRNEVLEKSGLAFRDPDEMDPVERLVYDVIDRWLKLVFCSRSNAYICNRAWMAENFGINRSVFLDLVFKGKIPPDREHLRSLLQKLGDRFGERFTQIYEHWVQTRVEEEKERYRTIVLWKSKTPTEWRHAAMGIYFAILDRWARHNGIKVSSGLQREAGGVFGISMRRLKELRRGIVDMDRAEVERMAMTVEGLREDELGRSTILRHWRKAFA